jgi:hypothetical protein
MRIMRALRLFRVVEKIGDLQKIIVAVGMSILPTLEALVSLALRPAASSSPLTRPDAKGELRQACLPNIAEVLNGVSQILTIVCGLTRPDAKGELRSL